ncbi:MAG TPA: glycosyltransferase family 39 protein [Candidatus Eisenbacteria bacterium]
MKGGTAPRRPGEGGAGLGLPAVTALLAIFLAASYWPALSLVFISDDYAILDKTLHASFASLWTPHRLLFNWYRPVSRELHYWAMQRAFGIHELPFHLASFALWLAGMALYFALARHIAGTRVAALATAAVAALACWAGPLLWVAGVQELWFFLFALLFLHAFARRRGAAAALLLALALLSKETAAVLTPLAFGWALLVDRERPAAALRRVAPLLLVTAAWALLHPRLLGRLWGPYLETVESAGRPSPAITAAKTALALVSLDELPHPQSGAAAALLGGLAGAAALAALAAWAALGGRGAEKAEPRVPEGRAMAFAVAWGVVGSLPVFMPSINWHAYYGLFGAFGAWLAIMHALRRRPGIALALVVALAAIRPLRADTPSWDWASEAFQRRAGYFLRTLRDDLLAKHPAVPPHSRLYFARVPQHIGWVAGDGPALRVWYRDSTISGGYYSYYRPRGPKEEPGRDYFFRFDSSGVWVEVVKGPEGAAAARDPEWEQDHRELAHLLGSAGDWAGAAHELVKLADASPDNFEYPLNAAVCFEKLGDSLAAGRLYARAASLPGATERVQEAARRYARRSPRH